MISHADLLNELNEFANCARIFRPASEMISSRFTSSTSKTSQLKTSEGVISDDPDVLMHRPADKAKEESPAEQAARMGMYGGLTRSIEEFWPSRLLCKRFNVKPPKHVEASTKAGVPKSTTDESTRKYDAASFVQHSSERSSQALPDRQALPTQSYPPSKAPKDVLSKEDITKMMKEVKGEEYEFPSREEQIEENVVDVSKNDALEGQKAAEELFKSVFGDDDSSDDDDLI